MSQSESPRRASLTAAWGSSLARKLTSLRAHLAAWQGKGRRFVRRHWPNETQHLFALTLGVGAVCGLVAVAFHLAIRTAERALIERALHAEEQSWMVWTVVSPTVGGLLAGALLTYVVPGARGSGVPQVKQAFALETGRIRARDAVGKFFISALQIGSGASLGREGPTVHICAGVSSLLARITALPPRSMRRLTPVGVAAGIAAAFNAPVAAVTFTIEEIVGSLDHAVLSGVVVAAAVAAVIERGILGVHPVIEVRQAYGLDHLSSLPLFALLGLVAAATSVLFTDGLLKTRLWFRRRKRLPLWMHPAIGGLGTGVLAVAALKWLGTGGINGGGYDTLGRALAGQLSIKVLVALCAAKLVATVLSYSSGGAGGVFAPSLFVGAMLGGAVGHLDVAALGHEEHQIGAFALVGMGAVFAGVIRAPITSVLIIFEMTGGYGLVLPLMIANMTSYVLARRLRPVPIYEALLAQDGVLLPRGEGRPTGVAGPSGSEAPRVSAELLMMPAEMISASEGLPALIARRAKAGERAFVLRDGDGELAAILPVHLDEYARNAELERLLIAADIARPAATVVGGDGLSELVQVIPPGGPEAAVVFNQARELMGVVTRVALAEALLEWHALRSKQASGAAVGA